MKTRFLRFCGKSDLWKSFQSVQRVPADSFGYFSSKFSWWLRWFAIWRTQNPPWHKYVVRSFLESSTTLKIWVFWTYQMIFSSQYLKVFCWSKRRNRHFCNCLKLLIETLRSMSGTSRNRPKLYKLSTDNIWLLGAQIYSWKYEEECWKWASNRCWSGSLKSKKETWQT